MAKILVIPTADAVAWDLTSARLVEGDIASGPMTISGLTNGVEYTLHRLSDDAVFVTPLAPRETHVFILGGQSNGTDLAPWDNGVDWPAGSYQLERWIPPLVTDMPGSGATEISHAAAQIITASRPLHHHYPTTPGRFGWSLQFVADYMAANPNVDVVLIPCCWGATGFTNNRWNPGNDLYADMVARTNAVIAAHPTWSLKGLLWHQGETDSTTTADANAYPARLETMIAAFRDAVASPNLPFVCGGYVADFAATRPLFLQTMAAQADLPNRVAYTGFAPSTATMGQGGADAIHFNAAGMRTMGSRYLAAWQSARSNAPSAPAQVTGLVATPGDGQVLLSWTAPAPKGSPITDYLIEVSSNGGASWSTVSDGISTATSYTHTGRTNGTALSYRISAVNAIGTGAASATASATPVASAPGLEAGAAGHWLFGADNTGLAGLAGGTLTVTGAPAAVHNAGYVALTPANGSGLVSGLSETSNMTMCIVFRMINGAAGWENVLIGNLSNTGGQALFQTGNLVKHNKQVGTWQISSSTVGSNGVWTFAAVSLDAAGNRVLYVRKAGAAVVTTDTVVSLGLYASPIAIGPVFLNSVTYNDPFDVAEAIVFAGARTQADLDAIYARTAARLSARGITLGSA